MALSHTRFKALSRGKRNTVRALAYRSGTKLQDPLTKKQYDYSHKEVPHVELLLPEDAAAWAVDLQGLIRENRDVGVQRLMEVVEAAEKRADSQVWREFEFALPRELTDAQNLELMRSLLQDQVCGRGIGVLANIHVDVDKKTGERKPHCHALLLTRRLEESGLSAHKERSWNAKSVVHSLREQYAAYTNFHLQLHGHSARIDSRSYAEQGIELEPQQKLGRNILEMESRGWLTRRLQAFEVTQLRNLYRVISRPEVILNRVTRHHTTFMWGDVQAILKQHVKDETLFKSVEMTLRQSRELVVLEDFQGLDRGGDSDRVYTTQTLLRAEVKLVATLERLSGVASHGVDALALERVVLGDVGGLVPDALWRTPDGVGVGVGEGEPGVNAAAEGEDLPDFVKERHAAVRHLTAASQVSCLVGGAGTGKTTVLKAAQAVWEASNYRMMGLAPTGRAARNLEEAGLPSQTLHRFLWDVAAGRQQVSSRTVLVLDEAGMVDVGLFGKFLEVVEALGVKAVLVGDSAQLQPVAAGAAFRLVTGRVAGMGAGVGIERGGGVAGLAAVPAKLETVFRQKEAWQQLASRLLGSGEMEQGLGLYLKRDCLRVLEDCSHISPTSWMGEFFSPGPSTAGDVRLVAKQHLLRSWMDNRLCDSKRQAPLILAHTNADVLSLNGEVRKLLQAKGYIERETVSLPYRREAEDAWGNRAVVLESRGFSVEDRVRFTRNEVGLGVQNGLLGTLEAVSPQKVKVRLEAVEGEGEGRLVSFAPALYPYLDQGWAMTVHQAQGITVDRTFVLASKGMDRNLTYVAMTRHRESVEVLGAAAEFGTVEGMVKSLSRPGEKLVALDYVDHGTAVGLQQAETPILERTLGQLGHQVAAIQAVSREAWDQACEVFLGKHHSALEELRCEPVRTEAQRFGSLFSPSHTPWLHQGLPPGRDPGVHSSAVSPEGPAAPSISGESLEALGSWLGAHLSSPKQLAGCSPVDAGFLKTYTDCRLPKLIEEQARLVGRRSSCTVEDLLRARLGAERIGVIEARQYQGQYQALLASDPPTQAAADLGETILPVWIDPDQHPQFYQVLNAEEIVDRHQGFQEALEPALTSFLSEHLKGFEGHAPQILEESFRVLERTGELPTAAQLQVILWLSDYQDKREEALQAFFVGFLGDSQAWVTPDSRDSGLELSQNVPFGLPFGLGEDLRLWMTFDQQDGYIDYLLHREWEAVMGVYDSPSLVEFPEALYDPAFLETIQRGAFQDLLDVLPQTEVSLHTQRERDFSRG
jgi:Ti-type conjugative transfer relaxase TraA